MNNRNKNDNNNNNITVSNLSATLSKDSIYAHFIPFGEIIQVETTPDPSNADHQIIAHIEYEESEDAAAAIDNMHETELYGEYIVVLAAAPKTEQFEGLGSKVPLWEQEGFIQKYLVDKDAMQGLEAGQQSQPLQGAGEVFDALPVSVGPMPVK